MSTASKKTCTKCGETKPLDSFSRGASHRDGYRGQCKRCVCANAKEWASANRPRLAQQARARYWSKPGRVPRPKPDPNATAKECSKCKTEKLIEDFPFTYRKLNQRRSICKTCVQLQKKSWRERNKDKVNVRARINNKTEKAKAQLRERRRRWRQRHPEKKKAENIRYRENLKKRKATAMTNESRL